MPDSPPAARRPLIPLANRLVYVYTFSILILPLNELQNATTIYFKEINSIRLALYGVNL